MDHGTGAGIEHVLARPNPSVKTGSCSRSQISSGVSGPRARLKERIASHVGS